MGNSFVIGDCVDCKSKNQSQQLPRLEKVPCENLLQVKGEQHTTRIQGQLDSIHMQILDKDGNEMKDEEIENFLEILSTLGNSVSSPLKLNIDSREEESNEGLQKLAESPNLIHNLRIITLDFSEAELIKESALVNLGEILKLFPLLENVNINFSKCDISDWGLSKFGSGLLHLTHLETLDLDLSECPTCIPGLQNLSKDLKLLTSLRHLGLKINLWNNGDDLGLISLIQNIKSLALSLESLSLEFGGWHKITNAAANSLGECLSKLKFLKKLSLNLCDCTGISDNGFQGLGKGFKGLPLLENLVFQAPVCERLTNAGLSGFADGLKRLGSLQELELDFRRCPKIGDRGLDALGRGLKQISSLRVLNVNFMLCTSISFQGGMAFKSCIWTMSFLQEKKIKLFDEDLE